MSDSRATLVFARASRRGVEALEILEEYGRVVGVRARHIDSGEEFEVLADWTVGDDGGNSLVRRACGIEMRTRLFPLEFFCFRFDWPETFRPGRLHAVPNLAAVDGGILALGGAPLPNASGAGIVAAIGREFERNPSPAATWAHWLERYPAVEEFVGRRRFPDDFARVKRYWGHAERYGKPGALLMGDAAHPPSPAGGQGANMAVADAQVLAKLLLGNTPDLVDEYEWIRGPANARSLRPSRFAQFVLGLPTWLRSHIPARSMARRLGRHPAAIKRVLHFFETAFQERE